MPNKMSHFKRTVWNVKSQQDIIDAVRAGITADQVPSEIAEDWDALEALIDEIDELTDGMMEVVRENS